MSEALPPLIGLPLVAALLALNAVFVATEFAYVSVRRTRVEQLAREGNPSALTVRGALGNLDFYVAAAQLGITMASIALGWFGEPALAALLEPPMATLAGAFAPAAAHGVAIAVAFALITGLHIVFGEFVPKTIALQHPDGTALAVARPIELFVRVFRPAIWLLNATGNTLLRLVGMDPRPLRDEPLAAEDLAYTLETSASAGLISRREFVLAQHALQLSALAAHELMVPRGEIVGIPLEAAETEVLGVLARHRHTRYPVYRESLDDVVGVLDAKQVMLNHDGSDGDWRKHIQPAVVLPESVPVNHALAAARRAGAALVILVDEYGGTAGLLSIFDAVEHLAGHLPDEYASRPPEIQRNPDGTLTLSGLARLGDLEEELGLALPHEEVDTVGGLVMSLLDRIPEVGDEVRIDGYIARVVAMDGRRIEQVLLVPQRGHPAEGPHGQGGRS